MQGRQGLARVTGQENLTSIPSWGNPSRPCFTDEEVTRGSLPHLHVTDPGLGTSATGNGEPQVTVRKVGQ